MSVFTEQYRQKLVTPEEAVRVVKSGDWVDYGLCAAQVIVLDRALAKRRDELRDVKIRGTMRVAGTPEVVKVDPSGEHFLYNSFHFSGADRRTHDEGFCSFVPILFHEVPRYYREFIDLDVAMLAVAPMDDQGFFSFSVACGFSRAVCDKAKTIVLEVNPNLPRCLGGREESVHISEVDCLVEADWPLVQAPSPVPNEIDRGIAGYIMPEIRDGACIQLGIGGMPSAIGQLIAASDLQDLGIHSEVVTDAFVDMVESGKVTGACKKVDRGKVVYTFALGTKKVYDFLHDNPRCATSCVDYTNDPGTIQRNPNAVAINNCVEIDLFGQVSSESSGPRQISGTGGQLDFTVGAYRSRGGKAFICFASTFEKKGKLASRVVPCLSRNTIVTVPRSVVSHVVTEYGITNLKGKSTWERAEALIGLANPRFRDELIRAAEELGIWRRSNKIA